MPFFATARRVTAGAAPGSLAVAGAHAGGDFASTLAWLPAVAAWHWTWEGECSVDCQPRLRLERPTVASLPGRPAPGEAPAVAPPLAAELLPPDTLLLWHADAKLSGWTAVRWWADLWSEGATPDPWGITARFPTARRVVASVLVVSSTVGVSHKQAATLAAKRLTAAGAAISAIAAG